MDYLRLVKMIEERGCVNQRGQRLYGTAALLHVLHRQIKDIDHGDIERGRAYVEKNLSA